MGRRLIATVATLAIGFVGALSIAAPASASTTVQCNFPKAEVAEFVDEAKSAAQADVSEGLAFLRSAKCLDIQVVHKCDHTTVVTMTNWVKDDNDWTVLTVELDGKEYTLEGGSSPNTETVTVGPDVEDLQAKLVFRGEHNGTSWEFKVNFGDPITWELPDACPTATPTPSASATPSPSPSVVTTSAATTTSAPVVNPQGNNDLPVTGASATLPIIAGSALLVGAVAYWGFVLYRRRKAEIQA